ncbi:MAG: hypothetical protein LIO85_08320 [Rikenellaceae bacterium]|nr:hypothetical protein [Rikenellaceae bacterium]
MKKTIKILSFGLLICFSKMFCYATHPGMDEDEFYMGQILYFDIDKLSFVLPSCFTVTRIGDDVNWDPFDAVYSIKTFSKQYLIYLGPDIETGVHPEHYRPLTIRDIICFEKDIFINHSCIAGDNNYIGIFDFQNLILLYRQDYDNNRFILEDSVKCVRCCPDPYSTDYYYPERYMNYRITK